MLPLIPYDSSYAKKKNMLITIKGLNHTVSPDEGELYDMENLSADDFPTLTVRKNRTVYQSLTKPHGLFKNEKLAWVDGTTFFYDGIAKGSVSDTDKVFGSLGAYILIWPDKKVYNTATGVMADIESTYTSGAGTITIQDGEYAGVFAEANTIVTTGAAFPFEVGQAIKITGCSVDYNNRYPVIREMSDDKKTLRFYSNTFRFPANPSTKTITVNGESKTAKYYTETGAITFKRECPDADFCIENENRAWVGKGDTIRCTALGNPLVWYDDSGLADGSWAVPTGTDGDFTGAASYGGFAIFFKEGAIHKVFGTKPKNFQISTTPYAGVKSGCAASLAISNSTLFYVSTQGVMMYQGGVPVNISGNLGSYGLANAAGGSDRRKYYLSTQSGNTWNLFSYDPAKGIWCREDNTHAASFALGDDGILCYTDADTKKLVKITGGNSDNIAWFAEWGDYVDKSPNKKIISRLYIQMELSYGSYVDILLSCDGGDFEHVKRIESHSGKYGFVIPVKPRRCDRYRLKLQGVGGCRIYNITRTIWNASEYRGE